MPIAEFIGLSTIVLPPVIKLVKNIFGKKPKDEFEAMQEIARDKPEALVSYVQAQAELWKAKSGFMQADISDKVSPWVMDLRASVRPVITYLLVLNIVISKFFKLDVSLIESNSAGAVIGWWFGERLAVRL